MRTYEFHYASLINIVAIGVSSDSEFDFGFKVSPLSIKTWRYLRLAIYGVIGAFFILCALYVVLRFFYKGLK